MKSIATADISMAGRKWGFPSELVFSEEAIRLRRGASWRFQLPLCVCLLIGAIALAGMVGDFLAWLSHRLEILIVFGGIGCWRWGWFMIQSWRAIIYRFWAYPRLKRAAAKAVAERGPVPEVTILAVTYHEKSWITRAVFESVFREINSLPPLARPARLVVVTGCQEDDDGVRAIYDEAYGPANQGPSRKPAPELVLLRGDTGKRAALATALREIRAANPHPDGVVVFMDGDSIMQPGLLSKVLPIFRLKPDVSAVTTNENGWVQGPRWFAEWISLRFGLRHRTMCSVALSGRLLCLTGRFSVFRASVAADPTFREQIERDSIHHWLWDSFDMLSGDDKSTWYWLAARKRRMLYVPDAMVTTLEVVQGSALGRALANIRRWSGNSLRHSWRAFKLGPRTLGWFCWYSLLDQRLAMWTVLVGPLFALLALCSGSFEIAAGYFLWVILSRLAHTAISWRHGRRLSAFYPPLQIISDWAIALTKIWILYHPAKQAWLNRGGRTLDTTQGGAFYRARTAAAHYLYGFTCVAAAVLVGFYTGLLSPMRERSLFLGPDDGHSRSLAITKPAHEGHRMMFGEVPARVAEGFRPETHPTVAPALGSGVIAAAISPGQQNNDGTRNPIPQALP